MKTILLLGFFFGDVDYLINQLCRNFRIIMFKNEARTLKNNRVEVVEELINLKNNTIHFTLQEITWTFYEGLRQFESDVKKFKKKSHRINKKDYDIIYNLGFTLLNFANMFRRLVQKEKIDLVMVNSDYSAYRRTIVLEAKKHGIPTFNVEHGFFAMEPEPEAMQPEFLPSMPFVSDYINLDNEIERDIWQKHARVANLDGQMHFVVNGTPNIQPSKSEYSKLTARSLLKLDPQKFTITLAGSWSEARYPSYLFMEQIYQLKFYELFFRALSQFKFKEKVQVIIKFHPTYEQTFSEAKQALLKMVEKYPIKPSRITYDNLSPVLAATDLIVCPNRSSILWEGFLHKIPGILFYLSNFKNVMFKKEKLNESNILFRKGCLKYVFTQDELLEAVEYFFDQENYRKYLKTNLDICSEKNISNQGVKQKIENINTWLCEFLQV